MTNIVHYNKIGGGIIMKKPFPSSITWIKNGIIEYCDPRKWDQIWREITIGIALLTCVMLIYVYTAYISTLMPFTVLTILFTLRLAYLALKEIEYEDERALRKYP